MAISLGKSALEIIYPESDGKPMAENTRQFDWIVTIKCGLEALFKADPNIFVVGDLFWYPVKGDPTTALAPDIMVVFGRPKGHRPSYKQWEEKKVAPQVVFEIESPGNTNKEWAAKMREIGLIPSDSGQPGGKDTGQKVTHYVEESGRFDRACTAYLAIATAFL